MGVNELRDVSGAKVYASEAEESLLLDAHLNVSDQIGRPYTVKADVLLKDGEEVTIDGISFKTLATPGHTKGSCCFYFENAGILVAGDTLFEGSVGRTDLPTGSAGTLNRSIKEKLMNLPDETKVYPGHGDATTISQERMYNPFCQ